MAAIRESIITADRHTLGNNYVLKSIAAPKRILANLRHAGRNRHARKITMLGERAFPDGGHRMAVERCGNGQGAGRGRWNRWSSVAVAQRRIAGAINGVGPENAVHERHKDIDVVV